MACAGVCWRETGWGLGSFAAIDWWLLECCGFSSAADELQLLLLGRGLPCSCVHCCALPAACRLQARPLCDSHVAPGTCSCCCSAVLLLLQLATRAPCAEAQCTCRYFPAATEDAEAAAARRAADERERDRLEKEEFEQRLRERDEVSGCELMFRIGMEVVDEH